MTFSTIYGSVLYEVKSFRYVHAGRTMADIELLFFEDGKIGSQAIIESTGEGLSPGKIYNTQEEALTDIVKIVEEKIIDTDLVQQTLKLMKK
ncbi:hypothetical protein ACQKP0_24665 [Heyndrickxia sp. NPDC080065]|uniref:hypothetical protein n=1 Tax=Heyndrickxia sp. NPDC080065 TaxID=3390568 RepID=UPI003D031CFC